MKIYIATKFENVSSFKLLQGMLEDYGHTITHDWTKESDEGIPMPSAALYRQKCAIADFKGVADADVVIMIPVAAPMAGAFVEIGIALAYGKKVIIVDAFNEKFQRNIFYYMPGIEHVSLLAQAAALLGPVVSPVVPDDNRRSMAEAATGSSGNA